MTSRVPAALIARIAQYSSCDLSDALVKLKYANGGALPDIFALSPREPVKICAEAFTVQMADANDSSAPKLTGRHFADQIESGTIAVISATAHLKNACWGGLLTTRAKHSGVTGVVIDGRCRDLAEHREAQYPVYARSHSTLGQASFVRASAVQVPLTITPIGPSSASGSSFPATRVEPYDIVLADEDGVVVVPKAAVEDVLAQCERSTAADAKVMADLGQGSTLTDAFARHR